jgi:hypothetical protein
VRQCLEYLREEVIDIHSHLAHSAFVFWIPRARHALGLLGRSNEPSNAQGKPDGDLHSNPGISHRQGWYLWEALELLVGDVLDKATPSLPSA